jgi:hypothetical protein
MCGILGANEVDDRHRAADRSKKFWQEIRQLLTFEVWYRQQGRD